MEVIIERACGMDVHKDSITACIMTPKGKEIQTFSTKTVFLLQYPRCYDSAFFKIKEWVNVYE
jgi:hypothetical protein